MNPLLIMAMLAMSSSLSYAADCGKLHMLASVPLEMGPDGKRPVVTAFVNSSPRKLLLDTGGGISSLGSNLVNDLKLTRLESDFVLIDSSGNRSNSAVRPATFELGGMVARGPRIMVTPSSTIDDGLDGVLATDFLYNYDIELNFAAGRMNMFDPDHCPGQVVYWPATAVAEVATYFISAHIIIPLTVDGKEFYGMIDTGATDTLMNMDAASRVLGVVPGEQNGILNNDSELKTYPHTFQTLSFAGVQINHPHILLAPNHAAKDKNANESLFEYRMQQRDDSPNSPGVTLGMDYMRRFHMYIAYKERKLYITAADPAPTTPKP